MYRRLLCTFHIAVERAVWGGGSKYICKIPSDTAETESEVAEKSSWDPAKRREKLGLVWRNRKKISQIINDYLCLPFFLLILLWCPLSKLQVVKSDAPCTSIDSC
jgi:hypothetical protein